MKPSVTHSAAAAHAVALLLAAIPAGLNAATYDWNGSTNGWQTTTAWTPNTASTGPASTDVARFGSAFSGASQPTIVTNNSGFNAAGAIWLTTGGKNTTMGGVTSSYFALYGVDGTNVGRATGTNYGLVIDDNLNFSFQTATTLPTLVMPTSGGAQTWYVGTGDTVTINSVATTGYFELGNGTTYITLTVDGAGNTTIYNLNNKSTVLGGYLVKKGSGQLLLTGPMGGR